MGKVEIKIRKKILTPDNLQQYRNYPALLKKYERNKRFKRALRIFIYSLGLTLFVLALIFLGMWKVIEDKKQESSNIYKYQQIDFNQQDTLISQLISKTKNDSAYIHIESFESESKVIIDTIKFPISAEFNESYDMQFVGEKICSDGSRDFKVLKYSYQGRRGSDVKTYYFYSPDFGVLIFRNTGASTYGQRLVSVGDNQKNKVLPALIRCIESDSVFYRHDFD